MTVKATGMGAVLDRIAGPMREMSTRTSRGSGADIAAVLTDILPRVLIVAFTTSLISIAVRSTGHAG